MNRLIRHNYFRVNATYVVSTEAKSRYNILGYSCEKSVIIYIPIIQRYIKRFMLNVYWHWFLCTLRMSCRFYIFIYRRKWKYRFCWQMVLQNKCNLYFIWVGPVFCLATPKIIDWLPINFIRRKKSLISSLLTS